MYSYAYITTNASNTVLYTGAQGSARAMRSRGKPGMTELCGVAIEVWCYH
ncbi:MAG: hypothetical protein FWE42_04075 [Defluviitaleaceae bacterium]|nr:hypothetical protein [Defluviitaleaceae bacterium]